MDNRQKILKIMKSKKSAKTSELVELLGLSRQKVSMHLNRLVKEGLFIKTGATKSATYHLSPGRKVEPPSPDSVKLIKKLKGLKEDEVFGQVELRLGLKKIPKNVQSIAFYAFGEMLNNAIDHSQAEKATIDTALGSDTFQFTIKDSGVGIFANVQRKFKLEDEFVALEHVLKGKQTTFPEQHSGQGIFFTSRIADLFIIRSHRIELRNDNEKDDFIVKEIKYIKGTEVHFEIKRRSRKVLKDLFMKFANDDYEFDRTNVTVHLTADRELLARSQAKRILMGLEHYKMITLDFSKVKEIGQAFVDEVFRVFRLRYPDIQITYINANAAIQFMIQRGIRDGL